MRTLYLAFALILLSFFMASCAGNSAQTVHYAPGPSLKICATIFPVYALTADLVNTRKGVSLEQIVPRGTVNAGDYRLTENQKAYFSTFDMCVINGFGLDDHIAEALLAANPKMIVVDSSKGIEPLFMEEGDELLPNPYIWTSVSKSKMQMETIKAAVIELDRRKRNLSSEENQKHAQAAAKEIETRAKYYNEKIQAGLDDMIKRCGLAPRAERTAAVSVAVEGYYFDYLTEDAGISIGKRIPAGDRSNLASAEGVQAILLVEGTGGAELQAPAELCFLDLLTGQNYYMPDASERSIIKNYSSLAETLLKKETH